MSSRLTPAREVYEHVQALEWGEDQFLAWLQAVRAEADTRGPRPGICNECRKRFSLVTGKTAPPVLDPIIVKGKGLVGYHKDDGTARMITSNDV